MRHTQGKWESRLKYHLKYNEISEVYEIAMALDRQSAKLLGVLKEITEALKTIAKGPFDEIEKAEQLIQKYDKAL